MTVTLRPSVLLLLYITTTACQYESWIEMPANEGCNADLFPSYDLPAETSVITVTEKVTTTLPRMTTTRIITTQISRKQPCPTVYSTIFDTFWSAMTVTKFTIPTPSVTTHHEMPSTLYNESFYNQMNQTTKSQDVITLVENNPIIVITIILLLVSGLIICCCLLLTSKYSQARKNIELARKNSEKLFRRKQQPIVRATRTVPESNIDSQEMSPLNNRPLPIRPFSEYATRPEYMNHREAGKSQQSTSYQAQVHQPLNKSNTLTNENLDKIASLYETPIA